MSKPGRPRECSKCGCDRIILIDQAKIREQGMDKAEPHSKNKALYWSVVTLARLCVPCFLRQIGLTEQAKFSNLDDRYTDCVTVEDEK
jgi:hypothetical protein